MDEIQAEDVSRMVKIGPMTYVCLAGVELGDNIKLRIARFDCEFSDGKTEMVITSSCKLEYSLTQSTTNNTRSHYGLRLLLSAVLTTLVMLGSQSERTKVAFKGWIYITIILYSHTLSFSYKNIQNLLRLNILKFSPI